VLASGIDPHDYAGHLFEIACLVQQPGRGVSSAMAMASPSTMERRFTAMLDPVMNRRPLSRAAMAAIGIAVLAVVAPLAMLSAHERVSASPSPIIQQPT